MDQISISASAQLEKILKENGKDFSSDEKTKLTNLIKDLKAKVQNKRERAKKFGALEKSLKGRKSLLLKKIEDIRKSLDDGSMSIVGKANISVPPEQKESEAEHAFQLLDELYKQASAVIADLVIEKTDTSTTAKTAKGGKGKGGNSPMKMESRQVSDKIKSVSSVLTEMGETIKQVKKLKHESDFLSGLLEALYDSLIGGEDKMSNKQTSASPGIEQSGYDKAIKILRTFQEKEREAEHTSDLLDQLYKQATAVNGDQGKKQTDMSKKDNKTKAKEKGKQIAPDKKKTETDNVLKHDEKFESVSFVLKKMDEANNGVGQLKYELECLEEMLDELKKTVSEGGKEPITLSASAEKEDERQAYKSARQILKKFKEKQRLAEHATNLLDDLYEKSVQFTRNQVDKNTKGAASPSKPMNKQNALRKTNAEAENRTPSDAYSTLDKRCKVVLSALSKLQEIKGEADHASKLLDQLYKQVFAVNVDQVKEQTDKKAKDKPLKGGKVKEVTQDQTKQESDVVSNQEEKYKSILLALVQMEKANKDAQRNEEKELLLAGILDDLFGDVRDLVEGKTSKSALDQRREFIDEEKESLTHTQLQHAKMIYEIQVDLKREAEYAARLLNELKKFATTDEEDPVRNILSEPPKLPSRGEDREGKRTNANQSKKLVGGNASSVQLNQNNYEIASAVVNKQIEAQYAARLLDELSNFSQTAIEGEDRKILSDPPVRTEQGTTIAETSQTVSQQIQHNKRSSTHFEKASAILNQIKEKKKLLMEKNHIEEELKNLQATIDLYASDIKISERKNLSLQQDTEEGNKQSEERLKKLQRLSMENSELTKEINNLRTRLSEIAGAKLTHENPSIADLSDPNRPTKLAEKYSEIYDNQWTDAFSTLSKLNEGASDEDLTGHLYNILVDGYRLCASIRMRQKKRIEVIMLHPDVNVESIQVSQTEKVNEIFSKLLNDAAKISSNMTSINMAKAFKENDEMQNKYGKMMVSCKTYIEECVKLSWLMQIQTPPVCIDLKTAKKQAFPKDTYREFTSKGKHIAFVVWPALYLHDGGPLLAKGVAQGK